MLPGRGEMNPVLSSEQRADPPARRAAAEPSCDARRNVGGREPRGAFLGEALGLEHPGGEGRVRTEEARPDEEERVAADASAGEDAECERSTEVDGERSKI